MDAAYIHERYNMLTTAAATMLALQKEYFDGRKRGYNEPQKLAKSKTQESYVDGLLSAIKADLNNPELFGKMPDTQETKDFLHFVTRLGFVRHSQQEYFRDKYNKSLLQKCKSLEHEITALLKKKKDSEKAQKLF